VTIIDAIKVAGWHRQKHTNPYDAPAKLADAINSGDFCRSLPRAR
jgi:hypothetical protein